MMFASSSLIPLSLLGGGIGAYVAFAIAFKVISHIPRRTARSIVAIIVVLVVFPLAVFGTSRLLVWATTHEGTAATPETANKVLRLIKIPASARSVDFQSSFFRPVTEHASFLMSESEFLGWCALESINPLRFAQERELDPGEWGVENMLSDIFGTELVGEFYAAWRNHSTRFNTTYFIFEIGTGRTFIWRTTY